MAPFLCSVRELTWAAISKHRSGTGFTPQGNQAAAKHSSRSGKPAAPGAQITITLPLLPVPRRDPRKSSGKGPPSWDSLTHQLAQPLFPTRRHPDRLPGLRSQQALNSGFGPVVPIHGWLLDPGLPAIGPDHFESIDRCQLTDSKVNGPRMLRRE